MRWGFLAVAGVVAGAGLAVAELGDPMRFVQIEAHDKFDRSKIADLGVSIEWTRSDSVWGFANVETLERVRAEGIRVIGNFDASVARGGSHAMLDFPPEDERFHNYNEMLTELRSMNSRAADISRLQSIGKTIEGRDIWAININTSPEALLKGTSNKPGVIFMGGHHAREHVSMDIPLMLAKHLIDNRADAEIARLLDTRDIWIIPMVNPDGSEWDIQGGRYKMWRKNRHKTGSTVHGVDLNRNYGYGWGGGGSSDDPGSDIYRGEEPFSEPETQAIRDFVGSHLNAKVLLTFHTFSELILYPWGGTYDPITDERDRQVLETMAQTMARWNGYTPQQSSDLYIASGDTTDWAYGTHGIFAFTFELSPKSMWDGGFYPGQRVLDRVFQANLRPALYMIDVADDPYRVIDGSSRRWLSNYVEPGLSPAAAW